MSDRKLNFGSGPSALPIDVLNETASALLNFNNTGVGIAEVSHRSPEFSAYLASVESLIREQLSVPSTHAILFAQGGATAQFGAVVLNMLARHRLLYPELKDEERVLDYVVTGTWSAAGLKEAKRLVGSGGGRTHVVVDAREHSGDGKSFDGLPPRKSYQFSAAPAMVYYCENETANGVQFSHGTAPGDGNAFPVDLIPCVGDPTLLPPLVADYSSSFLSRPIPSLASHAVIYAGAQKNLGPAGLTVVIVRKDCIVDTDAAAVLGAAAVPACLSYKILNDGVSMPNTPPVLSIYVAGRVLERVKRMGGVEYYEGVNRRKMEKVYRVLEEGERSGVVKMSVREGGRSWMNVTFRMMEREKEFLSGAETRGLVGLKGHRAVGGIRVSLYNAISEEDTDKLVEYLRSFLLE